MSLHKKKYVNLFQHVTHSEYHDTDTHTHSNYVRIIHLRMETDTRS